MSTIVFSFQSLAVTSIVAAAATAPFALYHFDRVAAYGLIANLLAMPVVTFLAAPAAAVTMVLAPFGLSEYGLAAFGKTLEIVLAIAHWADGLSDWDFSVGKAMPPLALLVFATALALAIVARGRVRWVLGGAATLYGAFIWTASVPAIVHWVPSGEVLVLTPAGAYQKIDVVKADGLGPLRYSKLAVTRDCSAEVCRVDTRGGPIIIAQAMPLRCEGQIATLVVDATASGGLRDDASCGVVIDWAEVSEARAVSLYPSDANGALEIRTPQSCGSRPWRPCPRNTAFSRSGG